jgi:2-hydroxychromene-2-carboxylate isomerase
MPPHAARETASRPQLDVDARGKPHPQRHAAARDCELRRIAELTGMARRLQQQFPVENARKRGAQLVKVIDGIAGPFRSALLTIFASVGALLPLACPWFSVRFLCPPRFGLRV